MSDSSKEILYAWVSSAVMLASVVGGITVGVVKTAYSADDYAAKVGIACVQAGGEWNTRSLECRR